MTSTICHPCLPDLGDDMIHHISTMLPPTLNVCLVNKQFYKNATSKTNQVQTDLFENVDPRWVWKQLLRSTDDDRGIQDPNGSFYCTCERCNREDRYTHMSVFELKKAFLIHHTKSSSLSVLSGIEDTLLDTEYELILFQAIHTENLQVLDWLYQTTYKSILLNHIYVSHECIRTKSMRLLSWVIEKGVILHPNITSIAIKGNFIEGLQHIVRHVDQLRWKWCVTTLESALAEHVCMETILWMMEHGCTMRNKDIICASKHKRIDILEALILTRNTFDVCLTNKITTRILEASRGLSRSSTRSDLKRVFDLLYIVTKQRNYTWHKTSPLPIIMWHNIQVVKWAIKYGCPFESKHLDLCVRLRRFHVAKLLVQNGVPWSPASMNELANTYDASMIRFGVENGCAWTSTSTSTSNHPSALITFLDSNKNQRKDLIAYALQNGCPVDEYVFQHIMDTDDLDMLKWFVDDMGVKLTNVTPMVERIKPCPNIMTWIYEKTGEPAWYGGQDGYQYQCYWERRHITHLREHEFEDDWDGYDEDAMKSDVDKMLEYMHMIERMDRS